MARKTRVHFPGALYHVMCRGNQGQRIFNDDRDRQRYVELLKESQQRFGCRLYAYVLMGNHVHLLIEVGQTPLSKVMQNVLFRYTRYWNRRYRKMGHLFQGRYKAFLCEKEGYLLELIRYLHLNPVRSKIVKDPTRYAWSSHRAYLKGAGEGWMAVEEVLPRWGKNRAMAVAAYQRFVREGLGEGHRADLYAVVDQRYLGNDAFVERVEQRVLDRESPRAVEIRWAEVNEAVCKQFGISVAAVLYRGRGRRKAWIKRVMTWVGREVGGFPNQEMAKALGQDPSALSRGLRKLEAEMGEDRELQKVVQGLCNTLRKGRKTKRSIRHA